ncbi:MAG TPA: ABC transporter substrate-binding protein [Pseudolabrys sp.]|nr:ABC transporter substrate-binding protein [Pseudolabrys sp.]
MTIYRPDTQGLLIPSRRSFIKAGGAALGTAVMMPHMARAQAKPLYINTWGGPWEAAAKTHLFDPFTKETGIEIRTVSPVSFAKLAAQVKTGAYEFDITTLGGGELVRANQAKIIEPWTNEPFKGAVFENGVASHAFATIIGYRKDKYPNGGPKDWKDFWDVAKFPGPRSLQRYPVRVLPFALLADGVPMDKLYPLDVDRAFKSLDKIKKHVRVWWTAGNQSTQILRDGEVDMIGIWHGRYYDAEDAGAPVGMTWNQGETDVAYWVVAKGTPNEAAARKFIEFAVSAKPLAGFVSAAAYGPANPAANEFIPADKAARMPTSKENASKIFDQDIARLGADPADISRRFEEWLSA